MGLPTREEHVKLMALNFKRRLKFSTIKALERQIKSRLYWIKQIHEIGLPARKWEISEIEKEIESRRKARIKK